MLKTTSKPFVFLDYDDTIGGLMIDGVAQPTTRAYDIALDRFASLMQTHEVSNLTFNQIRDEADYYDQTHANTHGFAQRERFALALEDAYRIMAKRAGKLMTARLRDEVISIGESVFQHPYTLLPGAKNTLDFLRDRFTLILITKGNQEEQTNKINTTGVAHYFAGIHVVDYKDLHDWQCILRKYEIAPNTHTTSRHWSIGNAVRSDINIPLTMGVNALHVKQGGWALDYEDYVTPTNPTTTLVITNRIGEVPTTLPIEALV